MKPNKFFENKKKEKQVLVQHKMSYEQKIAQQKRAEADAKLAQEASIKALKGKKGGLCNRSACLSSHNVIFFNKGTRLYYCDICAKRINEYCNEDDLLCKTDEGVSPREWRLKNAEEQRKRFMEGIGYEEKINT